jgi:probable addiction module antidote protein
MATHVTPFDAAEYLTDEASIAAFLDESFASGDAAEIGEALGIVARARSFTDLARQTGLTRQALYKALSREGNPRLDTLLAVTKALGYEFKVVPRHIEQTPTPAE